MNALFTSEPFNHGTDSKTYVMTELAPLNVTFFKNLNTYYYALT